MLKIIRNGKMKKKIYRFECTKCGCIWETDEVRIHSAHFSSTELSNCPYCKNTTVAKEYSLQDAQSCIDCAMYCVDGIHAFCNEKFMILHPDDETKADNCKCFKKR